MTEPPVSASFAAMAMTKLSVNHRSRLPSSLGMPSTCSVVVLMLPICQLVALISLAVGDAITLAVWRVVGICTVIATLPPIKSATAVTGSPDHDRPGPQTVGGADSQTSARSASRKIRIVIMLSVGNIVSSSVGNGTPSADLLILVAPRTA